MVRSPRSIAAWRPISLILSALTAACASHIAPPEHPNIVIMLIDTLRADHLGFYGYEKETAPFLAQLAKDSIVFERAFSTSSWTAPATASLFTSVYPHQHGVVEGFVVHGLRMQKLSAEGKATVELNSLSPSRRTLPEHLQSIGYTTFGLAANINIGEEIGFSRGFDQFIRAQGAPASAFVDQIETWKEQVLDSAPFFLYLHFNDPHVPYHQRHPYYERQDQPLEDYRAKYLSEVGYVDEHIRTIYETLDLSKDTILVILSDHGEEFGDHGGIEHGDTLYNELNQVLMMFHAPFLGWKSQRITLNVSLIDVFPTLVNLVDVEPMTAAEGRSLAPLLTGGEEEEALAQELGDRTLFAHRIADAGPEHENWAVIRGHWKLIETSTSAIELYDHRSDPKEKRNLDANDLQAPADELLTALDQLKKRGPRQEAEIEKVPVKVDEELLQTLRSLGYVK